MDIRVEQPHDEAAVRRLHRAAFGGDHGLVVADLVDSLRAAITADSGLSLVAVEPDGDVLGHAMFTPSLLDAPQRLVEVHVLSPLAVLPPRQNQGIGSALIRAGLQVMTERAIPVVFLEGDPRYYSRFSFAPAAAQGFRRPSLRIPEAGFQAIRLPHHQPWMTGTLVYSETFWRHDLVGLRDATAGPADRDGQDSSPRPPGSQPEADPSSRRPAVARCE